MSERYKAVKRLLSPRSKVLSPAERAVLSALNDAAGTWVSGSELARVAGCKGAQDKTRRRRLRDIIPNLCYRHRLPIGGFPGRGYILVTDRESAREYLEMMQQYGRDFFARAAVVSGVCMGTAVGQLALSLFGPDDIPEEDRPVRTAVDTFLAAGDRRGDIVALLSHVLDHVETRPDLYREGVEVLRKKYGHMLLSPEDVKKLDQLKKLAAEIGAGSQAGV